MPARPTATRPNKDKKKHDLPEENGTSLSRSRGQEDLTTTTAFEADLAHREHDQDHGGQEAQEEADLLAALNDPGATPLGPAPLLGGGGTTSNIYGRDAMSLGRASSPRLWAQASQFPTCSQLRVWRWENGLPVGLGAIDAEANEEDFVREFYEAMPRAGQGRMMFKLRPIDIRGEELGKELSVVISEHHAALQAIRRAKKAEAEEASSVTTQTNFYPASNDNASEAYAAEMSRMFEKAIDAADTRAQALENTLMDERERLRMAEDQRAAERIDLASNAAAGVQAVTERMMRDESARADRALRMQNDQSQMLLTTLTQIFASAQSQQQSIAETARAADLQRLEQERQFGERSRSEEESRHKRTMDELDRRQAVETRRLEEERKQLQEQRVADQKALEAKLTRELAELNAKIERDKADGLQRLEREKLDAAMRLKNDEMRLERERRDNDEKLKNERAEADRRAALERADIEARALREKTDLEARISRENRELENRYKLDREERERKDRIDREERERRDNLDLERKRLEAEERQRRDKAEADERERRAKLDADERAQRREELDRRANAEAQMAAQREADRQRAHELAMKQLELNASRDKEHAEKLLKVQELAMKESENRAAAQEADRIRAHERLLKEAETRAAQDREHAERMMTLSQMQHQQKAFGGLDVLLPKAKEFLGVLGMEPGELVQRLFAPEQAPNNGGGGSAWAEAIPRVLSSIAEMGKVALDAQAASRLPPRGMSGAPQQMNMAQPNMAGIPSMPQMGAMPGMPGMPGFNLPPGAKMSPVPGYPGMMAVEMPANTPGIPGGLPAVAAQPEELQLTPQSEQFDFGENSGVEPTSGGEQAEPQREEVEPEPAEAPSTLQMATEAGLNMATQRRVRKALRVLVRQLGGKKEDAWQGLIASAISNEIGIYHYVKAVTIRAALLEAGAEEELAQRVMDAMRASGMIPSDVEYE